jgi:ATP dependent DNA ligase C terminal region
VRNAQPYSKRIAHRGIWVEPKLLAEIEYRAKSAEGKVRHPVFKGLREDLWHLSAFEPMVPSVACYQVEILLTPASRNSLSFEIAQCNKGISNEQNATYPAGQSEHQRPEIGR